MNEIPQFKYDKIIDKLSSSIWNHQHEIIGCLGYLKKHEIDSQKKWNSKIEIKKDSHFFYVII